LGLVNTRFVNPHGLDADGHVSSAADLLRLTLALWEYPLARSMMGTARVQRNGRELINTNEWLGRFAGATGVKTGTTVAAGECLIASVEQDGRTLLVIVMGSQARYRDAEALYTAARRAYRWPTLDGRELSILNRVLDGTGKVWYMQPTGVGPTVMQVAPGMPAVRSFRRLMPVMKDATALHPGRAVGTLEWWAGAQLISTQSLVVR
jgi:D-alanyl-D-alanine carboxypeptidase (penicillin-binding protein 5/6)